jgi:TolB-like protein
VSWSAWQGLSRRPAAPGGAAWIESLAVLPLEDISGDPAQEYFADGMTHALITELAKIRALHVTSRTSVMSYTRTRKPLPQIAQEPGVDALVEGLTSPSSWPLSAVGTRPSPGSSVPAGRETAA